MHLYKNRNAIFNHDDTDGMDSPTDVTPPMAAAYLEVTDLNSKKLKYIPVPRYVQSKTPFMKLELPLLFS